MLVLFWIHCLPRLEIDYNDAFEKLVQFNEDLVKWVTENNPEHRAMSKFPKKMVG